MSVLLQAQVALLKAKLRRKLAPVRRGSKFDESKHPRDKDGKFKDAYGPDFVQVGRQIKDDRVGVSLDGSPSGRDFTVFGLKGLGFAEERLGNGAVHGKPLTDQEKDALEYYAARGYGDMNAFLRGKKSSYWNEGDYGRMYALTQRLDGIFKRVSAPEGYVVYRTAPTDKLLQKAVGSTFVDEGFVSTTISRDFGYGFDMAIRIPKGSKALYTDPFNQESEGEVLIGRGSKFKVLAVDRKRKQMIVELVGTNSKPVKWPKGTKWRSFASDMD